MNAATDDWAKRQWRGGKLSAIIIEMYSSSGETVEEKA